MFDVDDYEEQYASHYEAPSFETTMVRVRRERVLASLLPRAPRRLLEIGCGLEPLFTSVPAFDRFTVVEPAERFVRAARASAADRPEVEVRQGFFEDQAAQLRHHDFDFVVVSSLLHEVPDAAALLRAVHSVCGPDTVVHVNVPNVHSFHRLLAREMGLIADVFEPSETERRFQRHARFSAEMLRALLVAHGFRVVAEGSYFVKPFTHDQMQRLLDSSLIDDRVIEGLSRMAAHMPGLGAELYADIVRT